MIFKNPSHIELSGTVYESITALVAAVPDLDWGEMDAAIIAAWTDWAKRYGEALEGADATQHIVQLQATIGQLKLELTPDIAAITPALMDAGLLAWGERATMANSEAVLGLVIELRDVAMAPRSIGQCDRIKDIFGEIRERSRVDPTAAEAQAMQAILDVGPPSTGPIASKYLSFAPWM
jgi:hypothetical protein